MSKVNDALKLDKQLYREAFEQYRLWNSEKQRIRIEGVRERSASQSWAIYLALWDFAQKNTRPSKRARQEKLISYARYYRLMKNLDKQRAKRGTGT